ncbi:hypothetical protein NET03_12720 [Thermomicrobium sp. CFH 73360]|uniref:hypothetical protein n=1 Tax=Thermomicrobium sp. CFH 73360 TaxID=2951987 RepID=UPI002076E6D9|nr:hypothetical protein [Thermomicrobium sp. CFH 73360]MCM8747385.1 hypothetical protein [Thermomicrobium sp. CFH 73360]
MVVVRPQSRRVGWFGVAAIALGIIVLAIAVIFWASSRESPVPRPEVTGVVERIQAELDVLQVSLYTDHVVRNGQVRELEEYAAAQTAVQRARAQWEAIREAVSPEYRDPVDRLFEELQTAVNTRAPAAEVQELVRELEQALRPMESTENSG